MLRWLKIGLIVLIVLSAGFLILIAWGYQMMRRSFPVIKGELLLPGLESEVLVYRDGYHVPYINAQNEHDLFFAQGYITAQDRLWQMDLLRRSACGRLSQIFGNSTIKKDSLMLIVGINRAARSIVSELSPESQRIYKAYSEGVNAYIRKNQRNLPVEFNLLDYQPHPWRIVDCISILRFFSWQMSAGSIVETSLSEIFTKVGEEEIKEIFPIFSNKVFSSVKWKDQSLSILFRNINSLLNDEIFLNNSITGNSWVVSGNKSVSGKPLLANNPHFPLLCPSFFYEICLKGDSFSVSGFSIPGFPLVIMGFNDKIAWGITNLLADDLDLFIEKLNPSDLRQYLYDGTYKTVKIIKEEIPVKQASLKQISILETHRGSVLNIGHNKRNNIYSAVSLCWTGSEISDEGLALYHLNKAEDWSSFRKALRFLGSPSLNVTYADTAGNIGCQAAGNIPIKTRFPFFLPRSGEDPKSEWKGYIPYEDLPSVINPEEGYITSTNNRIKGLEYYYPISNLEESLYPDYRIRQLLSENKKFSVMDFKRIQSDVRSEFAKKLLSLVLPLLTNDSFKEPIEQEAIKILSLWNGEMKPGSAGAAFFEVFLNQLMNNVFSDEIGDSLYADFADLYIIPLGILFNLVENENSVWFDNRKTEYLVEDKKEIVLQSFRETLSLFAKQWGNQVSKWAWGKLHTVMFQHPLGNHPILNKVLNLGPFHVGGSLTTINCMIHSHNNPYKVLGGVTAKMIVDLSNLDNSISVISTGQSGHSFNVHYKDQVHLYLNNLYHPNLLNERKIDKAGLNLLTLQPGGIDE